MVEDAEEEDCGVESDGEDAQQRYEDSGPERANAENEWEICEIDQDQRAKDGVQNRRAGMVTGLVAGDEPVLALFCRFLPLEAFGSHLEAVASSGVGQPRSRHNVPWTKGTFLRFLGIIIRMAICPLPDRTWHWRWPAGLPKQGGSGIPELMTEYVFNQYWAKACIPGYLGGINEEEVAPDGKSSLYHRMLELLEKCNATWQSAWNPGTMLTMDESMVFWKGTGEVHVTYQPRKPTKYGIELKSMVCSESKIMLKAEMAEGKELDAAKEYRDFLGASPATTLRLAKPYAGSGRVVIGDSWFGSCNTAEQLFDELGMYCILAIKTSHKGFPKKRLVAAVKDARGAKQFMKVNVKLDRGERTFYAGAYMDKIPLLLVGTCGTSALAAEVTRERSVYRDGGFETVRYSVRMPGMHDTYRRNFNGVDLFNRDCFGSYSLQHALRTKSWARRLFLALVGMCEVNAQNAYRATVGEITRFEWLLQLQDKLINNPWVE